MITNQVKIEIVDSPEEAPHYEADVPLLQITKAIVVANGMESGKPSIDIQMVDVDGNEYVILVTGAIMENIGSICAGVRERTNLQ